GVFHNHHILPLHPVQRGVCPAVESREGAPRRGGTLHVDSAIGITMLIETRHEYTLSRVEGKSQK
ncbi:MAG TPA: hypothetical protein VER38_05495, partial [Candidatus Eisenbacteria bacterium]|nr:hypothetical protein [Candidatus Eisenbacteria bacterium]